MNPVPYPNITGATQAQQLEQIKRYLHQLARELNRQMEEKN